MKMRTKESKMIKAHVETTLLLLKEERDNLHEISWDAKVKMRKMEVNGDKGKTAWYKEKSIVEDAKTKLDTVYGKIKAYEDMRDFIEVEV